MAGELGTKFAVSFTNVVHDGGRLLCRKTLPGFQCFRLLVVHEGPRFGLDVTDVFFSQGLQAGIVTHINRNLFDAALRRKHTSFTVSYDRGAVERVIPPRSRDRV